MKRIIFLFFLFVSSYSFAENVLTNEFIYGMEFGTEIYAIDDGKFISHGYNLEEGNYIEIEYLNLGFSVKYCNLSSVRYFFNGIIRKNDLLGKTGNSGSYLEYPLVMKITLKDSFFLKNNDNNNFINEYDPTLAFCFTNKTKQNFTLKHSVFEISDFNYAGYEIYKNGPAESKDSRWCILKQNGLSLVWDEKNGNILFMETESSDFSTLRCVNVGDSVVKVLSNYSFDADVYEYDSSSCNYRLISDKKDNNYLMYSSNDEIIVNAVKKKDEEQLTMHFYLKDGVVSKIKISCVD